MSDIDPLKGFERLARVAEDAAGDDPRAATFVRGLVLGALVGAAIAGSTIWQRRRVRANHAQVGGSTGGSVTQGTPADPQT